MRKFTEERPLTLIVGAIVIALLALALPQWSVILAQLSSGDARIIAAVIYGVFTLVGIVLSACVTLGVGLWKDRRERNSVATVLMTEIIAQADLVATIGSFANAKTSTDKLIFADELARFFPPSPAMYTALADRIVLFSPEAASAVVTFYGAVERAKDLSASLPERSLPSRPSDGTAFAKALANNQTITEFRPRVVKSWRSAARNGVAAIKSLRPYVKASRTGVGREKIEKLLEELALIALAGGTPRHSTPDQPTIDDQQVQ